MVPAIGRTSRQPRNPMLSSGQDSMASTFNFGNWVTQGNARHGESKLAGTNGQTLVSIVLSEYVVPPTSKQFRGTCSICPTLPWHPQSISSLAQYFSRSNLRALHVIQAIYFTALPISRLQQTSQTSQSHQGWVRLFQVNVSSHPSQMMTTHMFYLPLFLYHSHSFSRLGDPG